MAINLKGKWARLYRELPGKPLEDTGMDYSLNRVYTQWGGKKVKELLKNGRTDVGYYEYLVLLKERE